MHMLVAIALCAVLVSSPVRTQASDCSGDCNGDGVIRINEMVRLVDAVLSATCPIPEGCPIDSCLGLDADDDGFISINELNAAVGRLVLAVRHSLVGCPTSH